MGIGSVLEFIMRYLPHAAITLSIGAAAILLIRSVGTLIDIKVERFEFRQKERRDTTTEDTK